MRHPVVCGKFWVERRVQHAWGKKLGKRKCLEIWAEKGGGSEHHQRMFQRLKEGASAKKFTLLPGHGKHNEGHDEKGLEGSLKFLIRTLPKLVWLTPKKQGWKE